jgi:hypothetical protein
MGFLELDVDDIARAVVTWTPAPCFSERKYRDSLLRHLQATFPANRFHAEFKTGKGRADIFVDFEDRGAKVLIELKYNLQTMNECNRLIGQIGHYVDLGEVLAVLCGDTKPELAACVAKRLQTFCGEKFYRKGRVILKPPAARARDGRFVPRQAAR